MGLKHYGVTSFVPLLMAGALFLWVVGVMAPALTPSSHEMNGHTMTAHQDEDACQITCALIPLQTSQRTISIGRFITQPEPLNLRYTLLLTIIFLPLAVGMRRLFLLRSWRPPDIPLLTHKYSVSL